jgi:hypothetical protein
MSRTILWLAAEKGPTDVVNKLLHHGADIDAGSWSVSGIIIMVNSTGKIVTSIIAFLLLVYPVPHSGHAVDVTIISVTQLAAR